MSRTFKDRPLEVRRRTPAVETRPRACDRRGRVAVHTGPRPRAARTDIHARWAHGPDACGPRCEFDVHAERRDERPRFYTNVSSADLRDGWVVPDRRHSRDGLAHLLHAVRGLSSLDDVFDELDDSRVQPHAHRRNEMWGGGYFD